MLRKIFILALLGSVLVMLGSAQAANTNHAKTTPAKTKAVTQKADCAGGTPVNCETGKPCTAEEMTHCSTNCGAGGAAQTVSANSVNQAGQAVGAQVNCKTGKPCTPEEMAHCTIMNGANGAAAQTISANSVNSADQCGGVAVNCKTGKPCTPEEMETCQTECPMPCSQEQSCCSHDGNSAQGISAKTGEVGQKSIKPGGSASDSKCKGCSGSCKAKGSI